MGISPEQVERILETLRASKAAHEEQIDRPGLEDFHPGRAEALDEATKLIEMTRGE